METISEKRLDWIDTLRGLAALMVALMHCFEALRRYFPGVSYFAPGGVLGFLILDVVNLGKIGVVVFFFISGYLIPFSLFNKDLKHFATTRFFRLYPAYWFSLILWMIVISVPPLVQLLANITMFQKFVGIEDVNGVYWTLQIELVFYMICASLFYFGTLNSHRTIVKGYYVFLGASLLMAAVRYFLERKLPVALPLGLAVMFLGILFRKYMKGEAEVTRRSLVIHITVFCTLMLPICLLAYNRDYGFHEVWYRHFVSYLLAILFFILIAKYKWHNRVFGFLGAVSYSLYLLHPIMGLYLTGVIKERYPLQVGPVSFVLLFLSLSVLSAAVCYYFIEKPSVNLGRRIINRRKLRLEAHNSTS